MINVLIDFLSSVPEVIWSGVIASGLTVGGVLISNRSNTKRLRLQLQHDSAEKARERHATLRREVYLKAVEELTKVGGFLVSLPQKDPAKENLGEGIQSFAVAAAKLQLVAEPKTADLARELSAAYGVLNLKLLGKVVPLQKFRTNIAILDDLWKQTQGQVDRVLADMVKFNESRETDVGRWQALQRSFDGFSSQAAQHAEDRAKAWSAFNAANIEFFKQLLPDLRSIAYMQIPLLVEIRRELGLATDLNAVREQMEKQFSLMSEALSGIFEQIDAQSSEAAGSQHGPSEAQPSSARVESAP